VVKKGDKRGILIEFEPYLLFFDKPIWPKKPIFGTIWTISPKKKAQNSPV